MPDFDYLPRRVGRHWNRAANAISGRNDPSVVSEHIEKAMAATLRATPTGHLAILAEALTGRSDDRQEAVREAVRSLPLRWVKGDGSCFVDTARILASDDYLGGSISDDDVVKLVSHMGLHRAVEQRCFAPMEGRVVPGVFAHFQAYRSYARACLDLVRTDYLADQVARGASAIRAPRRRTRRKSTRELLYEPI